MHWFSCVAGLLCLAIVNGRGQSPSPIPIRGIQYKLKIPESYEELRMHDTQQRDHGCQNLPKEVEHPHHCENIFIKNKFSAADIPPGAFFTEFQYHNTEHSWKPAVTWVEHVAAKYVRACVAAPGGKKKTLSGGKIKWLALYNQTISTAEQFGRIQIPLPVTAGHYCFPVTFPRPFIGTPVLKFTMISKDVRMGQEAMAIWLKGVSSSSATVCVQEFYSWSRYHTNLDLYWYGMSAPINEDHFSVNSAVTFGGLDAYPADHNKINNFFCKNVTLPQSYYPCPTVLLQPEEPSMANCETPLVAWIAYMKGSSMVVCYGDKRGIRATRGSDIKVHYIVYGHRDPCMSLTCNPGVECNHPTWNTARCGCPTICPSGGENACGTNMMTYKNRCELDKAACESGFKFSFAHKGKCENFTMDHGRDQLIRMGNCDGLYCKVISTRNNIWYPDADINVQISVNWNSNINSMNSPPIQHDATASWIEDVKPTSFKACVMEAGRRALATAPVINWFAYQGELEEVKTKKIEVGEWREGTHCVPLHERQPLEKPMEFTPQVCPAISLKDFDKVEKDRWQYDAHLMSQVYGKSREEWFKRMLMGYGIKRMKLTSEMVMDGSFMLTVEQSEKTSSHPPKDAVNVWMEYDAATREPYICLREMNNWVGTHKDIQVHWTLFGKSFIRSLGFSHSVIFKPHYMAKSMYGQGASCQTKKYLPDDMNLINHATILVSLAHAIPETSAMESMKKYQLHHMEMMKGSPIGEFDIMKKDVQESWTMPHMWRANLTGWRPHMRIQKNTDYSVWIEGMNTSHVTVCQKSLFTGYHYEGVKVSMFILPDRCQFGSLLFKDSLCGQYMPSCQNHSQAGLHCQAIGGRLAVADDCRENVWLSYLSNQAAINIAKNDINNEGTWVRDYGNVPNSYARWGVNQPSNATIFHDCAMQGGRLGDFTEYDGNCATCLPYVCIKPAPFLSCNFRKPGYCNDCGDCTKIQPFSYTCNCRPPFGGARCDQKINH